MPTAPLRLGLSACILQPDPERIVFNGRRLLYVEESMAHYVMRHGALPVLLPTSASGTYTADELVETLDAVVIVGGVDMAPESYGETALKPEWSGDKHRDAYEIQIVKAALRLNKPLLGVCRGHQVLNVAMGGTLFQDIKTQNPEALVHRRADIYEKNEHQVRIEPKSGLGRLFGASSGTINSVHHQAVKDPSRDVVVEARSQGDGIVECIRVKDAGVYAVGVQWHPEFQEPTDNRLLSASLIIEDLLKAAKERRRR